MLEIKGLRKCKHDPLIVTLYGASCFCFCTVVHYLSLLNQYVDFIYFNKKLILIISSRSWTSLTIFAPIIISMLQPKQRTNFNKQITILGLKNFCPNIPFWEIQITWWWWLFDLWLFEILSKYIVFGPFCPASSEPTNLSVSLFFCFCFVASYLYLCFCLVAFNCRVFLASLLGSLTCFS